MNTTIVTYKPNVFKYSRFIIRQKSKDNTCLICSAWHISSL